MLYLLTKYSGLLAIIFAFGFVVYPSILAGMDLRKKHISGATAFKKHGLFIRFGLIAGGLSQIIFSFYLKNSLNLTLSNPGLLLYILTTLFSIIVGFITYQFAPKTHTFFVMGYFIFNPISLSLIGLSVKNQNSLLYAVSILSPSLYFLGVSVWYLKYKKAVGLLEVWAFLCMAVWTIIATFI